MLSVTRYSIKNVRLKPWVKFIWYFETKSNILLNNKLLPTDSIDIILNLSDVMEYKIENQDYIASNIHFNGIRDKHGFIIQHGNIRVIGISFYPFGLYPFLKIPISEFNRQIVDLEAVSKLFAKIRRVIKSNKSNRKSCFMFRRSIIIHIRRRFNFK